MKDHTGATTHYQVRNRWPVLAILILASIGAVTRAVRADASCTPVHGTITSVRTTENCTSPVGVCTVGTITGAGRLDGATTFIALDAAPSAGMPPQEPRRTFRTLASSPS